MEVFDQISAPESSRWPHHTRPDSDARTKTKKTGLQIAVAIAMPSPYRHGKQVVMHDSKLNDRQGYDSNERLEYAIGLYHCPWREAD